MKTAHDPDNRCTHLFTDGRRCRMLQTIAESTLCPHHAKEELQRREAENSKPSSLASPAP